MTAAVEKDGPVAGHELFQGSSAIGNDLPCSWPIHPANVGSLDQGLQPTRGTLSALTGTPVSPTGLISNRQAPVAPEVTAVPLWLTPPAHFPA